MLEADERESAIPDGQSVLASASSSGHIALWDLNNNGRLIHIIRGAHDRAVSAVEWVPGQPVLVSSGEDNSVKVSDPIPQYIRSGCNFSCLAMVLRVTDCTTAHLKIPLGTPRTTTSHSILWRRWQTTPHSFTRPKSSMYFRRPRFKKLRTIPRPYSKKSDFSVRSNLKPKIPSYHTPIFLDHSLKRLG